MDIGGFIGRFHPLLVHLPIGFLFVAGIFEYYARKRRFQKLDTAVEISLFLGAFFAIASCVSGWLVANRGAYIEQSLFLHRWLGISVAVLATVAWLAKTKRISLGKTALTGIMGVMILGLFATGHFGGNMTHGEDYLTEYAPGFVQKLLGHDQKEVEAYDFGPKDSIRVYADLLEPVFEKKCWKCHQADNALGGLDMTSKTTFLQGGDHDAVLEAGAAYDSELFRRITLPVSNRKSMPPTGLALPYQETRLIEWWIDAGASFDKTLGEMEIPVDIQKLLEEKYGVSFKTLRAIEKIEVAAAEVSVIEKVQAAGFQVMPLSEHSNLLEVIANDGSDLDNLIPIKEQVTWLNLANANLDDSQVKILADFPNLTRLRLQGNPVTDEGISALAKLPFLESINLNNTKVTAETLNTLRGMSKLQSVYLFETNISDEAIAELQNARTDLEVVRGFSFKE